jgi:DNA-binding CsgD family transcriptional regulator
LLERHDCLAALGSWLDDVPRRGGRVVLVGAEAGLGKTTLLREFSASHAGIRTLWGACDALFTPRPLAPVLDIARQAGGPLWRAVRGRADREALFAAALDELEREPALVVLEDLHWADEATLDFLKFVGRRITQTRVLLAVSYRDDEVRSGHPLQFVLGDLPRSSTHRLTLEPLTHAAVASLAREAGRAAGELHAITGGNPLFVTEVLGSPRSDVPGSIREAALARVARLPAGAQRIVELASVCPSAVESWLLESTLHPAAADVDECLSIGMQRAENGAISFRHELLRRAIEGSLQPLQRRGLHALVLAALVERGDVSSARLAHHATGAGDRDAVHRHSVQAAVHAASVGAHREAAAHHAVALKFGDGLDARARALLQQDLSYEYYLTDQVDRALEARRAALAAWQALGDRLRTGDTQRWLSRLSWFCGRRHDAEQHARDAIATLASLPPGRELALAWSNQAQLEMLAYRNEPAVEWATRAIDLAERLHDEDVLAHALNNRGSARLFDGSVSGRDDLDRSLAIALQHGMHEHAARAYTNLSSTSAVIRDYATSIRRLDEGIAYCERHDLDSWRLYMLAWRARVKFERGDWLGAGDDAEVVVVNPRTAPIARLPALVTLGHLRARRGDPDHESPLREAGALAASAREIQRTAPLVCARVEAAWLAGIEDESIDELAAAYDQAVAQGNPWVLGELAVWLHRTGRAPRTSRPVAPPYGHELAGHWRQAADAWQALGCPYDRALVLGLHGDEAAQRDALAEFERLGATPASQLVRRRLRELGIRGVPRGARRSTLENPYKLTRREAQILELMRFGLRNAAIAKRLFLSTRTVDHHVSAVLTKLGVATRAEAVALATSAQEEPTTDE